MPMGKGFGHSPLGSLGDRWGGWAPPGPAGGGGGTPPLLYNGVVRVTNFRPSAKRQGRILLPPRTTKKKAILGTFLTKRIVKNAAIFGSAPGFLNKSV